MGISVQHYIWPAYVFLLDGQRPFNRRPDKPGDECWSCSCVIISGTHYKLWDNFGFQKRIWPKNSMFLYRQHLRAGSSVGLYISNNKLIWSKCYVELFRQDDGPFP